MKSSQKSSVCSIKQVVMGFDRKLKAQLLLDKHLQTTRVCTCKTALLPRTMPSLHSAMSCVAAHPRAYPATRQAAIPRKVQHPMMIHPHMYMMTGSEKLKPMLERNPPPPMSN